MSSPFGIAASIIATPMNVKSFFMDPSSKEARAGQRLTTVTTRNRLVRKSPLLTNRSPLLTPHRV